MSTYFRLQGSINSVQGQALDGVDVYVCTQPASTGSIPPSPLATIYADSIGTALANPVVSDGNGNWFFYADPALYTIVVYDPAQRIETTVFADQAVVTPGGGSVNSVGLTMPAEFTVAGSPVSTSGTLAVSKAAVNANLVAAGPASGSAAAWTFRALVAGDFPAGVGTVSSVGLAVSASGLITASWTGTNPITSTGTATLNLALANQAAGAFYAGPASGGSGPVTARAIVGSDIAGLTTVAFSATPVFDASTFAMPTFAITLTGNVTSSTLINGTPGQIATFVITQDATGSRSFAYPTTVLGESNVDPNASAVTVQSFVCITSSVWRATGPGSTNAT
jgi:hypothetical protein